MKQLLENVKPFGNDNESFEYFSCTICSNFAIDLVICSACQVKVLCRSCKNQWQN